MSGDEGDGRDEDGTATRNGETHRSAAAVARAYYQALDSHDYEVLSDLLASEFVHDRPEMRLEGRERFVRFMREERPQTDTTHELDGLYTADGSGGGDAEAETEVLARGRLLDADGERIVAFADAFTVANGRATQIETYTR
jgi:ketosteroid isomerase-like protein